MDASVTFYGSYKRKFTGGRTFSGASNESFAEYNVPADCYAMAFLSSTTHLTGTPIVTLFCSQDAQLMIASSTTQSIMVPGVVFLGPGQQLATGVNYQGVAGSMSLTYTVIEFYANVSL